MSWEVAEPLAAPAAGPRLRGLSRLRELTVHLARREIDGLHRFTLLGWAWPLVKQLALLAVLVLVFDRVIDLGIENYAAFVFSGLVAWTWFAAGVGAGASSLLDRRHLVFQPGLPTVVLPIVAVAVPLVDLLLALPLLVAVLALDAGLHTTLLFAPVLVAVQFVLMCGIAWGAAAATVFFRDVRHVVGVALTLLFYLTPVFYGLAQLPADQRDLLRLNPLATLIDGWHAIALEGRLPDAGWLLGTAAASVAVAAAGLFLFRRLSGRFVDEL